MLILSTICAKYTTYHMITVSLDFIGACLSLASTLAFTKEQMIAWPLGFAAASINGYLYAYQGIYADAGLELIYFGLIFYGWYLWLKGGPKHHGVYIRHIKRHEILSLFILGISLSLILGFLLKSQTHSTIPYIDATTAVFSLIGQWMIGKKIIECWLLWFIVDSVYVWLYINKAIPYHSLLMTIYLGVAIFGYINWRKSMLPPINRPNRNKNSRLSSVDDYS